MKYMGLSDRQIARELHLCRQTVSRYLMDPERRPAKIHRSSKLDPYKILIDNLLGEYPDAPTLILLRRLQQEGFTGEITIVRDYVRSKRSKKRKYDNCEVFMSFGDYTSPNRWMLLLLQGKISVAKLKQEHGETLPREDAKALFDHIHDGGLRDRKRSLSVLGHLRGISPYQISRFLMISRCTVSGYIEKYRQGGINYLFSFCFYVFNPSNF